MKPKKKEEKTERLKLVLNTMRNVNQLILREKDTDRLLRGCCHNLIKNQCYHSAWVALIYESGELLTSAEAGLGEHFSPLIEQMKTGELIDCIRSALSQTGVVVTKDPESVCTHCPLSASCDGRGSMAIRLEHEGRIYGILSVSVSKYSDVDKDEQTLFQDIAGDIAFALHSIEIEEKRWKMEKAMRESEERYRTVLKQPEPQQSSSKKIQPYPWQTRNFKNFPATPKRKWKAKKTGKTSLRIKRTWRG